MKDIKRVVGWTSAYLSTYPTVKFTKEYSPDAIVHCAAYTAVLYQVYKR